MGKGLQSHERYAAASLFTLALHSTQASIWRCALLLMLVYARCMRRRALVSLKEGHDTACGT